jgi:hypothetical protein
MTTSKSVYENSYFYTGWSFEEVLPFFKISEDNQDYGFAKDT